MKIPSVRDRYSPGEVAAYYRTGHWTTETFDGLLRRQAGAHGERTLVTDGVVTLNYRAVWARSLRLADGLRARGVQVGDRVAVQLPNWADFVVVAAAIARLGAILIPIMPIYRRDEVGHVLDDAQVSAVVTASTFRGFDYLQMYRELAAERPAVQSIVVVRADDVESTEVVVPIEQVAVDGDPDAIDVALGRPVAADDPFAIVYTSGTTARPKGCVHTFNTYAGGARALAVPFAFTEHDVAFGPSPVTHTTGLVTSVLMPIVAGAATHLMPHWEPEQGLRDIANHGCTISVTATAFLQMLLDAYDPARHDATSLRAWVCAGAPIPRAVIERARALLPGATVLSLYGRSENLTTTTCSVHDPAEKSLTSDGRALPETEVRVVDEAGAPVPIGTEGDIAYRGPSHMLGYLGHPEETALLYTPEGLSRSGDLGVADGDGFVRVTGRTKDIIIRGGMNISVRELEDLLLGHSAVRTVAVVGMPDRRLGERVCCYVVSADPAHPPALGDLTAYLLEHGVAIQKCPERLELVDELPTTATGKIQKHLLRRDIAQKIDEAVA